MKLFYTLILFVLAPFFLTGQGYYSDSLSVHFYAVTPISDIDAVSNSGIVQLNTAAKEVKFSLPVKSFIFKKALMQQHFNDKHMESEKYPLISFKAVYTEVIDFSTLKTYKINLKGKLNMHGVTKQINIPCDISVKNNSIYVNANFKIKPKDYHIKSPMVFNTSVAEDVEVTVSGMLSNKLSTK